VSTRVRLRSSVNANVTLQTVVSFKRLDAMRAVIGSFGVVYTTYVRLQLTGDAEALVTEWTLVRLVSRVDPHVSLQIRRQTKRLVTHVTLVQFHLAVNSAMSSTVTGR